MSEINDIEKTSPDVEKSGFEKTLIQVSRGLDIIKYILKKHWGTLIIVGIIAFVYWSMTDPQFDEPVNTDEYYEELPSSYYDEVELDGYIYYTGDTIWYEDYTYEVVQ